MMKKYFIFITLFSCFFHISYAQEEADKLPLKDAVSVGVGISFPMGGSDNDFTDMHKGAPCFSTDVNYRHYFCEGALGVGATYLFNGTSRDNDLLRINYIAPTLTLRALSDNDNGAFYLTVGGGYLHYADRIRSVSRICHTFNKGYFGMSFSLGYEWTWTKTLSSLVHIDFLTSRWSDNENYKPKWQRDEYEKKEFQTVFKPKLMFLSLGFDIQFGK